MRAGQSTIQQTLTTEAASVLNQSIAEAGRRNHGQTTPLHVAATLLASPTGYLRQACIRSHPNSSHPLQCRALELCFSVALERLPSAASAGPVSQPPISNALMAALKRAQAHQRRGCPEQQQQPLLAVKVELEQLIISILDDPSVSRVMREASFSSPAVKAAIEQSIASTSSSSSVVSPTPTPSSSAGGLGFRPVMAATTTLLQPNRGLYINPRLQHQHPKPQQPQQPRGEEEVKKVLDVMVRSKKRNPVLVGDSELQSLMKEALGRIERKEIVDGPLKNSHVISLEKDFTLDRLHIPCRMEGLANLIESCLDAGRGGVILNLGDLKWLVENSNGIQQQQQQLLPETGRVSVAEMGKLLSRFSGRVWLMGTATCATYLRCQVYHPTMETDWDLQAVPIAPRAPVSGMFLRNGGTGLLSSPVTVLTPPPHKGLILSGATAGTTATTTTTITTTTLLSRRPPENTEPLRRTMCPACTEEYERELGRLVAEEFEKASSNSKPEASQKLPPWLQAAKINGGNAASLQTREQELKWKQNMEGLLERWRQTCLSLHPSFHRQLVSPVGPPPGTLPVQNSDSPKILPLESLQQRLSPVRMMNMPAQASVKSHASPPGSPVRTDLVLGRPVTSGASALEKNHKDCIKDSIGCTQDFFPRQLEDKIGGNLDTDSFKRLFRGLTEKVAWQPDAAASVAVTVAQCRSGEGRRKAARMEADTWLLFLGHDKVGKKKMASALSEILFGTAPTTVSLGAEGRLVDVDGRSSTSFRRKTALGRIAEAVRQNPFTVFVIEDVDRADVLVRGSIKKAVESGRLRDSHGREVSLGSAVFIMTADSLPDRFKHSSMESFVQCEEKLDAIAKSGWQLELLVGERNGKRHGDLLDKMDRPTRTRTESGSSGLLSLDLNLSTRTLEEDARDVSRNSSDLTVEHDLQYGVLNLKPPSSTLPIDMMDVVDDSIVFKPVDFKPLRNKISDTIAHKFNSIVGTGRQLQVDAEALDHVVAGVWFGDVGAPEFEEWTKNVLLPSFQRLRSNQAFVGTSVARLVSIKDESAPSDDGLPTKITICRW